jgi:hypothetical protein
MLRLFFESLIVLIAPLSARADKVLQAATFAMIEHCQSSISGRADLVQKGRADRWKRVPSKGKVTEKFFALETEGGDIGRQDTIQRSADEFVGIELFPTRLMLIRERGQDAVSFVSYPLSNTRFACSFTTTFAIPFDTLEANFTRFATSRKRRSASKVFFSDQNGQFFSITTMPDQSSKPVAGATLSIATSAEIRQ